MRCHRRIKAVEERGKQQEIPAGDKDRQSMGEIEHETDKSVRETQRVGDLKDTAQEESSSNPAALAAAATSGQRSSRVHHLQFALQ